MTKEALIQQIRLKRSYLCVGIDPDPAKLPLIWRNDPAGVLPFCRAIIDATAPHCVAYKLNIAFFEGLGKKGWDILYQVRALLPKDCLLIADAKRADIGNTSRFYAHAFFHDLDFDAVTVAPYMGEDSVMPFLEFDGKWTILLALTSNTGAMDFQMTTDKQGIPLYERVLTKAKTWGSSENLMFVAGATHSEYLKRVREIVPDHFLLVPGIGAQGGNLEEASRACLNKDCGILVNSTRDIIYVSEGNDYAQKAAERAHSYQATMQTILSIDNFR